MTAINDLLNLKDYVTNSNNYNYTQKKSKVVFKF